MPQAAEQNAINTSASVIQEAATRLQAYVQGRKEFYGKGAEAAISELNGAELLLADIQVLLALAADKADALPTEAQRKEMADALVYARSEARARVPHADLDSYEYAINAIHPASSLVQRLQREQVLATTHLPSVPLSTFTRAIAYLRASSF